MTHPLDLEAREERAFRSRFEDGLADVLLGLVLLAMGATFETEAGGLAGVWFACLVPLWHPLHRKLIEPRLGYVEFGPTRQALQRRKQLVMVLALGLSVLMGLGMWFVMAEGSEGLREAMRPLGPLPFLVALGTLIALAGFMLHLRRGFAYAAAIIGFGMLGHAWGDALRPGLLAAGALVTVCGAVLLTRFLRTHPVLEEPLDGAGAP